MSRFGSQDPEIALGANNIATRIFSERGPNTINDNASEDSILRETRGKNSTNAQVFCKTDISIDYSPRQK
jgi:hypothetical protein